MFASGKAPGYDNISMRVIKTRFILFTKLEHYGIRDVALQWIKSYFSCRRQFVQINQTYSSMQTIKCGVPQGSILGPLFSILYVNDLPKVPKLTELLLFADDTSDMSSPAYSLPHRGRLSYGRSPRLLWQIRCAARNESSTVNRHQGRRVGRHKLPTPERRQNDNDPGI